jgi:hypothetical protein
MNRGQLLRRYLAAQPVPRFLDLFPNATAAFSLEALSILTVFVLRVRRSSDSEQRDFTAKEIINGTLINWVGAGNNGFVSIWYDQSGNNNHEVVTDPARQRQIVSNGSLILKNGKPSLSCTSERFGGSLPNVPMQVDFTALGVLSVDSGAADLFRAAFNASYLRALGNRAVGYRLDNSLQSGSNAFVLGQQTLFVTNGYNATQGQARTNGVQRIEETSTFSVNQTGINLTGSGSGTNTLIGNLQELILYNADEKPRIDAMEVQINKRYAIY